jgi:hypothetical protein
MRLHFRSNRCYSTLFVGRLFGCQMSNRGQAWTNIHGSHLPRLVHREGTPAFSTQRTLRFAVNMSDVGGPLSPSRPGVANNDEDSLRDNEFPDDISCLDHAPATSHGIYLVGTQDGVESLEDYQVGGYHPIHLGDCLDEGRYRVIHKLGHGGFSTVWLCRDSQEDKYVAVKIHTGDISVDKLPDLRLMHLDMSPPGSQYINIPKHHFSLEGPNGTHQCLVLTLLGPRVSPNTWIEMDNPGPSLRKFCQQTACALNFLHQNGICHGGIYSYNPLRN